MVGLESVSNEWSVVWSRRAADAMLRRGREGAIEGAADLQGRVREVNAKLVLPICCGKRVSAGSQRKRSRNAPEVEVAVGHVLDASDANPSIPDVSTTVFESSCSIAP